MSISTNIPRHLVVSSCGATATSASHDIARRAVHCQAEHIERFAEVRNHASLIQEVDKTDDVEDAYEDEHDEEPMLISFASSRSVLLCP